MDKVRSRSHVAALLEPVQASFLESPQVLPNKWCKSPAVGKRLWFRGEFHPLFCDPRM